MPPDAWPRVVWWSFYEGDASFDHFLVETLDYLSGGKLDATKMSGRDAVRTLWELLHGPGTLLVLDGFERVLRAFGGLDAAYQGDEVEWPPRRGGKGGREPPEPGGHTPTATASRRWPNCSCSTSRSSRSCGPRYC